MLGAGWQVEIALTGRGWWWDRLRWIKVWYCGVDYNRCSASHARTHKQFINLSGLQYVFQWSFSACVSDPIFLFLHTHTHTHTTNYTPYKLHKLQTTNFHYSPSTHTIDYTTNHKTPIIGVSVCVFRSQEKMQRLLTKTRFIN